jgi:hypothetical protein
VTAPELQHALAALTLALATAGCGGAPPDSSGAGGDGGGWDGSSPLALRFTPDELAVGTEDYLCFTYDASQLAGRSLTEIGWTPPAGGGVTLHHATLYAVEHPFPDGPFSCLVMPGDAVGLHIWAPGDQPLAMPADVGLAIPDAATKIVVQAHVLRLTDAPAEEARVELTFAERAPLHLAAWHSTVADVPDIPPHASASAESRCQVGADVHTLFAWPHMHRLGTAFHGVIERGGGGTTPLVDVPVWNVNGERTYAVRRDLSAGDVLRADCSWDNTTNEVVGAGFETTDEMCTLGVVWWPADAPRCQPL